jgi:type I restriction-modification system DNA methylase subunit
MSIGNSTVTCYNQHMTTPSSPKNSATIGFESTLWQAADKLRSSMDAAEYKHVVLRLIFLKYISDTFATHRAILGAGLGNLPVPTPKIAMNT